MALPFAYYAATAYCNGAQINNWSCIPCQLAGDVVNATFLSDTDMDVYGYVAKQSDGVVVVAFRGTNPLDIKDWIDDIWYFPVKGPYDGCSGCEVHQGFYDSYLRLSTQMYDALAAYDAKNAPAIYVTGHSLGAAMATLATYELVLAGYPVGQSIDFGRPRVGNPAFASSYWQVVVNHNFTGLTLNADAKSGRMSPILAEAANAAYALQASDVRKAAHAGVRNALTGMQARPATRALRHAGMAKGLAALREAVYSKLSFASLAAAAKFNSTTSFRVTHEADPVPHLPLEAMGFAHPPTEIWYNEAQSSFRYCSTTNGEDPTCSDSLLVDWDVMDHLSYMDISIGTMCL